MLVLRLANNRCRSVRYAFLDERRRLIQDAYDRLSLNVLRAV
jgi:hypothetical protein